MKQYLIVIPICFLLIVIPISTSFAQINKMSIEELPLPFYYSEPRTKAITHVVIHSISNVASKPDSPFNIIDIYFLLMEYGVSTHYVVGRDGEIYRFVPENHIAYHAGKNNLPNLPFFPHMMNDYSIGIELMGIGTKEEMASVISEEVYESLNSSFIGFTERQYEALLHLLDQIHINYPTIPRSRDQVIGHDDYAPGRKVDPGELFNWGKLGY